MQLLNEFCHKQNHRNLTIKFHKQAKSIACSIQTAEYIHPTFNYFWGESTTKNVAKNKAAILALKKLMPELFLVKVWYNMEKTGINLFCNGKQTELTLNERFMLQSNELDESPMIELSKRLNSFSLNDFNVKLKSISLIEINPQKLGNFMFKGYEYETLKYLRESGFYEGKEYDKISGYRD